MFDLFFNDLFKTFLEFLYAPLIFKEMLWILIPLIFAIVLMEIYFSKYPREGLGHHRSLENTIFLLFVYFDLIRYLIFNQSNVLKFLVVIIFLIFTFFVAIYDFFHKLPLKTIFKLSSKQVIAFFTYITIVLIYSDLLNKSDFIHIFNLFFSIILFFALLLFIRFMYSYLEPKSYEELESFLNNIEKDIKKMDIEIKEEEKKDNSVIKKITKKTQKNIKEKN
ncbi:MAG: hypothetical protein QW757_00435 [Candidatus Woesearchaeota archaeon]